MTELEFIFHREDILGNEPDKKVIIAAFEHPPVTGDYLMVSENMSENSWARKFDDEFMEAIKGETYLITDRIFTGDAILYNLERFDSPDSVGGFLRSLSF